MLVRTAKVVTVANGKKNFETSIKDSNSDCFVTRDIVSNITSEQEFELRSKYQQEFDQGNGLFVMSDDGWQWIESLIIPDPDKVNNQLEADYLSALLQVDNNYLKALIQNDASQISEIRNQSAHIN